MIKRLGVLILAFALTGCASGGEEGTANGPSPSPGTGSAGVAPATGTAPATGPAPTASAAGVSATITPTPGVGGSGDWKSALVENLDCPAGAEPVEHNALVHKDLTGDGRPEVLVAASCTGSTSSWPSVVHVYDGSTLPGSGHWQRLGVLLTQEDGTDDRGLRVRGIEIDGDTVVVTSRGFQEKDDNASGGSLTVTDRFAWSGTVFLRGERTIA